MIKTISCQARINEQDPTYPTYLGLDCDLHIAKNTHPHFYGVAIDCDLAIITTLVTACISATQSVRITVTIDGIPVTDALVGSLSIQHNKNQISTFSLNLGDTQYSPRTNSHIDLDKVVVITAYLNGKEMKVFTGSIDDPEAEHTPFFRVMVSGRDYGKKLLDKRMTLVKVQTLATSTKRNDLIRYIAGQAGLTAMEIPEMGLVTIDNSFSDQSTWDMIQKEAMVELYWVKCNEEGIMQLLLDDIKSDTTLYPTPDWTYGEDKIMRLSYKKSRLEINKVIVQGATYEKRIPTVESVNTLLSFQKYWNESVYAFDIECSDYNLTS